MVDKSKVITLSVITVVLISVFIAQFVFGINYKPFALNYYHLSIYQAFTSSFFHVSVWHFASNFFIWIVCIALFYYYKNSWMWYDLLLLLIGSQLLIFALFPLAHVEYEVGFSGILFTYLGFLFLVSYKTIKKTNMFYLVAALTFILIVWLPLANKLKGAAYWAHIVGFFFGLGYWIIKYRFGLHQDLHSQ